MNQSLSEEQEKELNALLADDEEAQTLYYRLRQLDEDLNKISGNDKAVNVSGEVMDKVHTLAGDKADYHKHESARRSLRLTHTTRYLAAAVAGILLGIGSIMLLQRREVDTQWLQGTMIAGQDKDGISYVDGKTHVRLIPYLQNDVFYLNFFINAPEEVEFTISFNANDFKPLPESFTSSAEKHAAFLNGQIHFTALNQASFHFVLEKHNANPAPIKIKAIKNNKEIIMKKISP